MFLVGLTGGIASGKSTVSKIFQELGVPVIDADVIARRVVEPGRKAWVKIQKEFGDDIFLDSGELDREAMGRIIFHDVEKRRRLNQITHPEIYKEIWWEVFGYLLKGYHYVVLDLPLLFETSVMVKYMHKVIVVSCEEKVQLKRLMSRNKMSENEAKTRVAAQMPLERKCEQANFVVENSGSEQETRQQVEMIVNLLRHSRAHWKVRALLGIGLGGLATLLTWITVKLLISRR